MNKEEIRQKLDDTQMSVGFVAADHGKYLVVHWLGLDLDPDYPYYNHPDLGLCPKLQFRINGIPLMQIDISLISKS